MTRKVGQQLVLNIRARNGGKSISHPQTLALTSPITTSTTPLFGRLRISQQPRGLPGNGLHHAIPRTELDLFPPNTEAAAPIFTQGEQSAVPTQPALTPTPTPTVTSTSLHPFQPGTTQSPLVPIYDLIRAVELQKTHGYLTAFWHQHQIPVFFDAEDNFQSTVREWMETLRIPPQYSTDKPRAQIERLDKALTGERQAIAQALGTEEGHTLAIACDSQSAIRSILALSKGAPTRSDIEARIKTQLRRRCSNRSTTRMISRERNIFVY